MSDLKAQLTETLDEAEWDWLKPHSQRDAILIVSDKLDLLDVGVAIAQDDTLSVQGWIQSQGIRKPSSKELSAWNEHPQVRFKSIIVQPYVLIQEMVDVN